MTTGEPGVGFWKMETYLVNFGLQGNLFKQDVGVS